MKPDSEENNTPGIDPDKLGSYARTDLEPQEVEAKWTYKETTLDLFDFFLDGYYMFQMTRCLITPSRICEKLNELARLKSYQGKVPSDSAIEQRTKSTAEDSLTGEEWCISVAKWVRSEISPYIAKLEEEFAEWASGNGWTFDLSCTRWVRFEAYNDRRKLTTSELLDLFKEQFGK